MYLSESKFAIFWRREELMCFVYKCMLQFMKLPSKRKIPCANSPFHCSIRSKIEKKLFQFSLIEWDMFQNWHRWHVSQFLPSRSQRLLIIWPIYALYIDACTYTCIIWCMLLHMKPIIQLQKWTVSYISACKWIGGNRIPQLYSINMCTKVIQN